MPLDLEIRRGVIEDEVLCLWQVGIIFLAISPFCVNMYTFGLCIPSYSDCPSSAECSYLWVTNLLSWGRFLSHRLSLFEIRFCDIG